MSRRGYSLLELMVVILVGAIVMGAVISTLMGQMQITSTQNRTMINQQNLREVLDYMTEELTTAGSGVDEPYIVTADAQEVSFLTDINGDGNWNRVRYWITGTNLRRELHTSADQGVDWTFVSSDLMLQGVAAFELVYYARGNIVTADVGQITSVEIRVSQNPGWNATALTSGKVGTGRMVSRATIRNRLID